ncbi:transmembrane protein 176B [Macrotis lagotis]|uniref:transmembrane protein 176B n=1 Tax=Macrotis lagotis TaxID=92651 RepID=UPI003D68B588
MSTSVIKVDGMQAVGADSQSTQINIHIHQESVLAKLLQAGCTFLQPKTYFQNTFKLSKRVLQAQLALGVSLILMGILSCAFGIFLYLGPPSASKDTGCAFWAGAVAIMAGAGAIIHEKCQSNCWGRLAVLLALISISTAVGALIFGSYSFEDFTLPDAREICEHGEVEPWTPSYRRSYDYRDWRTEECKIHMNMFLHLFQGVLATMLAIYAMILLVSLASLGVGLRNLCCLNSQLQVQEESVKKLLGQESLPPSPCKEKSTGIINL